jgi:anaerobic ribonucleoside-triphosphate reductase activating protein
MNEAEIVFILEPDSGRVTVETSRASANLAKEIERDLGQGSVVNCARPIFRDGKSAADISGEAEVPDADNQHLYLFRLYHDSIVDGFGRRSVVQVAGCSIRCAGCYVPETHERENGRLTSIEEIVAAIDAERERHDGVTILGGEPFDQAQSLEVLVEKLKAKNYHVCVYTGYTLENLFARDEECVNRILAKIDLLIDGAFDRNLTRSTGEYRGSSNQRLIYLRILRISMQSRNRKSLAGRGWKERLKTKADFYEFIADCIDEGLCPTNCPEGCIVEPDGVCSHNFKSIAIEYGLI